MTESIFDTTPLWDLDPSAPGDVVYFPVRHYSPASSRILWELAEEIRPTAVLVEGPADFNDRLDELMLDGHELPIALYTWVRLTDDTKRAAFYPYCEYAPEWQAHKVARKFGLPFRFIDLAWERMALKTDVAHRYSDRHFRENPYPALLCERLGVADFDELWDVFFELDRSLDWREYMRRCHEFCYQLRAFSGPEEEENIAREESMLRHVEAAVDEFGGPVLVVTGGFHSSGLHARRHGVDLPVYDLPVSPGLEEETEPPEVAPTPGAVASAPGIRESGITLTPFTYERIDKLSGYASGVHGPAFYEHVWERRRAGELVDCREFVYDIVEELRDRGQSVSTADVIGVETSARALASVRGREEVWRFDVLDAFSTTVVKEEQDAEYMHPVLVVARETLRGDRRGSIDPRAPLPPLVRQVRAELEELDLLPTRETPTSVQLDLDTESGRRKSQVLHRARMLGLAGFQHEGGTDFVERSDLARLWEAWTYHWTPEFDGTLIEAAVYGADLEEAATARALELTQELPDDAAKAARLAIDVVLMGVSHLAGSLFETIGRLVGGDNDYFSVCEALGHLLYLARHDEVLGSRGDETLLTLLRDTYERALWLLEGLGVVKDRDEEVLESVRGIYDVFRISWSEDADVREEFVSVLGRVGNDRGQSPLLRGAVMGALFSAGELVIDAVLEVLHSFAEPSQMGDFLVGFFSLAREAAQRDPRLMRTVDEVVASASDQEFLELLPSFRLAFTYFTPLEKHQLVANLFAPPELDAPTEVSSEERGEGRELERRMRLAAQRFGLRGLLPPNPDDPGGDRGHSEPAGEVEGAGMDSAADGGDGGIDEERASGDEGVGDDPGDRGEGSASALDEEGTQGSALDRRVRWRLVFGEEAEGALGGLEGEQSRRDRMMGFLYDREYGPQRNVRRPQGDRGGTLDPSQLTVPDWINGVHELFPRKTIERLERDALDRYQLEEIVTRPDVLRRARPNPTLLKAVLRTKHLMRAEVLTIARKLVRQVVEELMEKLARDVHQPFTGSVDRRRRSYLQVAKNFDAPETIRRNLKNWDPKRRQIVIQDPYFFSRVRRQSDRWQIIIVVDQSGSMLDSVIHAAVTASIFHGLKMLDPRLVAFDTQIVDLSEDVRDPVESLMKVQLGGGTDIANALEYAETLVNAPRRTIVVLVTDFYEGGPLSHLFAVTRRLCESGVTLLGLAALDEEANPEYDRETARTMVELGAEVGAMTPGELAEWVASKVR